MKRDIERLSSELKLQSRPVKDNAWVIRPEGVLDSSTSDDLMNRVQKMFDEAEKSSHFLFDMAGVRYISSIGLGTLISFLRRSKDKGLTFALYDTQLPVRRVLEISKLDFLMVDPKSIETEHPFADYIRSEENQRRKI